jgi:hypothetical protein
MLFSNRGCRDCRGHICSPHILLSLPSQFRGDVGAATMRRKLLRLRGVPLHKALHLIPTVQLGNRGSWLRTQGYRPSPRNTPLPIGGDSPLISPIRDWWVGDNGSFHLLFPSRSPFRRSGNNGQADCQILRSPCPLPIPA